VKLTVLAVGKVRPPLDAAVAEFEARAGRYWKLEVVEVTAGTGSGKENPDRVRAAEGERIRARLPDQGEVWVLTREGKGVSSEELARSLGQASVQSLPGITFVLGGAFGLEPELADRARRRLSLSTMTLPHEVARLLLAEQLYRAGTILRGEPYHKGRRE